MTNKEKNVTYWIVVVLLSILISLFTVSCSYDDDYDIVGCQEVNDYYDARIRELYKDCNIDWKCDREDERKALEKQRIRALNKINC